jgi:hypothetical protein
MPQCLAHAESPPVVLVAWAQQLLGQVPAGPIVAVQQAEVVAAPVVLPPRLKVLCGGWCGGEGGGGRQRGAARGAKG